MTPDEARRVREALARAQTARSGELEDMRRQRDDAVAYAMGRDAD